MNTVHAFIEDDLRKEFHEYLEKGPKGYPYLDIFDKPDYNAIELKLIQIADKYKGQGYGTAVMKKLIKWADDNDKIIVLSPSEIKTNKLIKWYKEFGFLENKGRNKDFRFMSRMIRYPKGLTRSKWIDAYPATASTITYKDASELKRGDEMVLEAIESIIENSYVDVFDQNYEFIAFDGNKPVGIITCEQGGGELSIVVDPEYHGRGIGENLVKLLIKKAKDKGYESLIAVPITNISRKMFNKLGFNPRGGDFILTEDDLQEQSVASIFQYNLIEYGGGEFSREQLEEFEKKPTLTESDSLEYIRSKYYNSVDKDYFYHILNKMLTEREQESFLVKHLERDKGEGNLSDIQDSYRYLYGNHPAEIDKGLQNYGSDFDMGTNTFASLWNKADGLYTYKYLMKDGPMIEISITNNGRREAFVDIGNVVTVKVHPETGSPLVVKQKTVLSPEKLSDSLAKLAKRLHTNPPKDEADLADRLRVAMKHYKSMSQTQSKRELKFKLVTEPGHRRAMIDMLEDLSNLDMVNIGRVYRYNEPGKSILEVHVKEANDEAYREIKSYLSGYLELDSTVDIYVDKAFVTDRPVTVALEVPNKDKNLGIPRRNMPQIKKKHFEKFLEFLKDEGVDIKEVKISPLKLKPTQNEFNMGKVRLMMGPDKEKLKKPLLVSSDNYILDGHHKWLANLNLDEKKDVKCIKVNLKAKDFLDKAKEFDKVRYKDIDDNTFKETDPNLAYASSSFEKALTKVKKDFEDGSLVGFMNPNKYEDELREELGSLNGKPIYRAVKVDDEGKLDPKKIGIYWTWDIDKAVAYWGEGNVKITLETTVTDSIVDWEATIEQWLKPQYSGECEVRLKPKAKLDINTIWVGKNKQVKKFTAVANTDTTHKDGFEHLERRTNFNVGQEFLNDLIDSAEVVTMNPEQLKKIGTLHNETFFNHSDREPVSPEEAEEIIKSTSEPMVIKWKNKLYALDGQHRINTAIELNLTLPVKIIEGKEIEDFETFGYKTKAIYPNSDKVSKPTIDRKVTI